MFTCPLNLPAANPHGHFAYGLMWFGWWVTAICVLGAAMPARAAGISSSVTTPPPAATAAGPTAGPAAGTTADATAAKPIEPRLSGPALEPLLQQASDWAQKSLSPDDVPEGEMRLRPEIVLGQLDSRLKLAPCAQVEPYLPRGARLWGRSRIGLRCVEGATLWNVFLPITVKVWGPAWVVRRALPHGAVLKEGDAALGEVDWAEHPAPVLVHQADWLGVTAVRGLMPGQVLRQSMVRPVQLFNAGTEVKVHVQQAGFQLSAVGRAMSHGFLGQSVRVKMSSGRVVSGRVRRDRSVGVEM